MSPQFVGAVETETIGRTHFVEIGATHSSETEFKAPHIDQFSSHFISDDNETLYILPIDPKLSKQFGSHDAILSATEYRSLPGQAYGRSKAREISLSLTPQLDPYEVVPVQSSYNLPAVHISKRGTTEEISVSVDETTTTIKAQSRSNIQLSPLQLSVQRNYIGGSEVGKYSRKTQTVSVTPKLSIVNFGSLETRVVDGE